MQSSLSTKMREVPVDMVLNTGGTGVVGCLGTFLRTRLVSGSLNTGVALRVGLFICIFRFIGYQIGKASLKERRYSKTIRIKRDLSMSINRGMVLAKYNKYFPLPFDLQRNYRVGSPEIYQKDLLSSLVCLASLDEPTSLLTCTSRLKELKTYILLQIYYIQDHQIRCVFPEAMEKLYQLDGCIDKVLHLSNKYKNSMQQCSSSASEQGLFAQLKATYSEYIAVLSNYMCTVRASTEDFEQMKFWDCLEEVSYQVWNALVNLESESVKLGLEDLERTRPEHASVRVSENFLKVVNSIYGIVWYGGFRETEILFHLVRDCRLICDEVIDSDTMPHKIAVFTHRRLEMQRKRMDIYIAHYKSVDDQRKAQIIEALFSRYVTAVERCIDPHLQLDVVDCNAVISDLTELEDQFYDSLPFRRMEILRNLDSDTKKCERYLWSFLSHLGFHDLQKYLMTEIKVQPPTVYSIGVDQDREMWGVLRSRRLRIFRGVFRRTPLLGGL